MDCARAERRAGGGREPAIELLKPLARLAHERHGLREHPSHDGADLLCLVLGVALDVDAFDRRDGHIDSQLDRVVGPCQALLSLHLLGEVSQPSLQLVRVAEQVSEATAVHVGIIDCAVRAERQ